MNGSTSNNAPLTAAQKLQEKHSATATHHTEVEEVVDEEDIQHPPPSMLAAAATKSDAAPVSAPETVSERAAGKRKVEFPVENGAPKGASSLNTQSEEAFPSLGGGPKPSAPPAATAWGARRPAPTQNGANGVNGHATPSVASSRASTPTSGMVTPATNASAPVHQAKMFPQHMPLPGRHKERISFTPQQLLPRNQLKKPLQEIIRNISRTSKANVEMRNGPGGSIIFEASGPVDAARQALKSLASQVGSPVSLITRAGDCCSHEQQTVKIPVPMSIRSQVIGRGGSVINGIMDRTGAKIQLPKDAPTVVDDDEDTQTVDVSITGDAVAAEMARREIESIVGERPSNVNLRLRDIPPELFPFIAGPRNSRLTALEGGRPVKVQVPLYHTWTGRPPPQAPVEGAFPEYRPCPDHHIRVSGDRLVAQEVKAQIEREAQRLRQIITLSEVPIDRGRHQFILENDGSLHDLLEETGCSIVLPPASEDTENLTVTGPAERLNTGLDKIMDLASAMQLTRLDVMKQHANAPAGAEAHARDLSRYLKQRRLLEELERQHSARIILPSSSQSPDWELYSREGRNGIRARQDIIALINAHPPQRLRQVPMDPFFHQHVHKHAAPQLREKFGVHLLEPDRREPLPHLVIVYEGSAVPSESYRAPMQRPSPQELAEAERNLLQAQEHILSLIHGQQTISAADVDVPPK